MYNDGDVLMRTEGDSGAPAPESAPRVSVIIPHLNTPDLLIRCLASLAGQQLDRGDFELIVADNGSTTPLDRVRAAFPQAIVVVEPAPGPGMARNRGASIARAPILAFIDADCRAETGWLQTLVDAVESDPAHGIVGGDVRIDFVDAQRLTAIEAYESVFAYRQRWYIQTQHFSGTGNLAMGAHVFAAVGPFKGIETAEDIDWGRRAYALGYAARYVDAMRIYHPGRTDFGQLARKWQRHVAHEFHDHITAGRSLARWYPLSVAVLGSALVHGVRMFTSPKLRGIDNRLRGLGVLFRIRAWRCREMLRLARSGETGLVTEWNRSQ